MTLEELCAKYKVAPSTVKSHWGRTHDSILKKWGVSIIRFKDENKNYVFMETEDDNRALTIYEEDQNREVCIALSQEDILLDNLAFLSYIGIIATPMSVFRGSYKDFLNYMDYPLTAISKENIKQVLNWLRDNDYIMYQEDKTNREYFIAGLYKQRQDELGVGYYQIKQCKKLADKYHKKSWVPLFKTYVALSLLSHENPLTDARIMEVAKLTQYEVKESRKILHEEKVFDSKANYIKGTYFRRGTDYWLTAWNDIKDADINNFNEAT